MLTKHKGIIKMKIGQKIKEIREEKDLKQVAVLDNQGQISQIEKGVKIKRPKEATLRIIAKKLDMSFEELIEGTDWSPRDKSKGQFVISPASYEFKIDDSGFISCLNSTFPKYNKNGDLTEFCPHTGEKLIANCTNCGREIEDSDYAYCIGCGTKLTDKWAIPENLNNLITPESLTDFGFCTENLDRLMAYSSDVVVWYNTLKECTSHEDWVNKINKGWVSRIGNSFRMPRIREGKFEIDKKHELNGMLFEIQLCSKVEKKLRKTLTHLTNTEETKTSSDKIYEGLFNTMQNLINENVTTMQNASFMIASFQGKDRDAYTETNRKLIETNEKSISKLADLLKSFDPDGDHSEIEQKLKSIKSEKISETQNSDEKISEDGNSETDAAENADRNNKNAENKKDKESKNE